MVDWEKCSKTHSIKILIVSSMAQQNWFTKQSLLYLLVNCLTFLCFWSLRLPPSSLSLVQIDIYTLFCFSILEISVLMWIPCVHLLKLGFLLLNCLLLFDLVQPEELPKGRRKDCFSSSIPIPNPPKNKTKQINSPKLLYLI